MKKCITIVLAALLLSSLMISVFADTKDNKPVKDNEANQAIKAENEQERILLLERALEPKDPYAAVRTWAEGVKTRNGALQYAVMSQKLKDEYYSVFAGLGWVTGVSSPWVDSYEITEKYRRDNDTYRFRVELTHTDSTKSYFTTEEYVTVSNVNDTWLVTAIEKTDVKGRITKVTMSEDKKPESVFVEAITTANGNYDKANVIIGSDTKIYKGYTDRELSADDLKEGTNISVTFTDDPMIMIYPVSAKATIIRTIDDDILPESIELRYDAIELQSIPVNDDLSELKKLETRKLGKVNGKSIDLSLFSDSSNKVSGVFKHGGSQYILTDLGYSHDLGAIKVYDLQISYNNAGNSICLLAAIGSDILGYKYVFYDETRDEWIFYHNWGTPTAVDINHDGVSEILMQFEGLHNNPAGGSILTYYKGQFVAAGINSAIYEKTVLNKGKVNVFSMFRQQDENILIDIELFGNKTMSKSYCFEDDSLELIKEEFEQLHSITYENTQYGFAFMLPGSWEGFDIVIDEWKGLSMEVTKGDEIVETGAIINIRHPLWTVQEPRQDIPIMIFTMEQWNSLEEGKYHIGAAPIGPMEIHRNSRYVFALPARYNFAFLPGTEEVERIMDNDPLID